MSSQDRGIHVNLTGPSFVEHCERGTAVTTYDECFRRLYDAAYRVAYRVLGDRLEAEDVAQETLARAFIGWRSMSEYPDAWVATVAANLAVDRWRRRRKVPPPEVVPTTVDAYAGERVDLVRALRALPRRQREVVVLRYLADHSEESVAAALGCSVGTVKTHASRGLAALRSTFDVHVRS
jgi:RNA polymerase sigma-70 factor (sigma-E family)